MMPSTLVTPCNCCSHLLSHHARSPLFTISRGMVSLVAGKNTGEKRDTEETAEEKKLRKAQIKQSKRVSVECESQPSSSACPQRAPPSLSSIFAPFVGRICFSLARPTRFCAVRGFPVDSRVGFRKHGRGMRLGFSGGCFDALHFDNTWGVRSFACCVSPRAGCRVSRTATAASSNTLHGKSAYALSSTLCASLRVPLPPPHTVPYTR